MPGSRVASAGTISIGRRAIIRPTELRCYRGLSSVTSDQDAIFYAAADRPRFKQRSDSVLTATGLLQLSPGGFQGAGELQQQCVSQ